MTIAPPARSVSATTPRAALARIEIAWTVSAGVLQGKHCYASAALHLECEWSVATAGTHATCTAIVDRAGVRTPVAITAPIAVDVQRRGRWTHVSLRPADAAAGSPALLLASFELGRMAYCTSSVPALAGLPGASYDPPTGILELYEAS
jgi:hypothetical protein